MLRNSGNIIRKVPSSVGRNILQQSRRGVSGSAGGGAAKAFLYTTGAVTAGAGGTVGYAWYDPEFRQKIENNVPLTKDAFQKILGEPRDTSKPLVDLKGVKQLGDKVSSLIPARKEQKESPAKPAVQEQPKPSTPQKTSPKEEAPAVKAKSSKEEEDRKKDAEFQKRMKERDEEVEKIKKKLEQQIKTLTTKMEDAVKAAVDAKLKAATMIENHTKRVKEAVEVWKPESNDPMWKAANDAYESMKQALKIDQTFEVDARAQLERLRKTVNEALASKDTSDHPILTKASETLNRWSYQLDEAISKVKQAETEQKITSEFKKLIEQGREQFAKELKSILPNVDINAKGNKLTEDELNALIAHAHVRVDQLRRQLAEQQLREQQHIDQALDRQKAEFSRLANEKVEKALASRDSSDELQLRVKLQEAKAEFEEELRKQMRRQAAAHSEHLEDVLTAQKAQLEAIWKREVDEAVIKERDVFNREIANSIARLNAIEAALEGRAEQDSENRRAKELWIACQHLRKAVLHGRLEGRDYNARRKPLVKEITAIKETGAADPFVKTLVSSINKDAVSQGVYTQDDLVDRFEKVKKVCRRTALIGENGGTLFQYFLSLMQSFFLFDRVKPDPKQLEEIDVNNIDTVGILWRAAYLVDQLDFDSAIKLMLLLKGEPARLASDWIRDARLHLETRRTAELLLAHASAVSMRTIY